MTDDTLRFEIDGFEAIDRALEEIPEIAQPLLEQAMTRALLPLVGLLREYPPLTPGNRARKFAPGATNAWYERNKGRCWVRKDGSVGSDKASEDLSGRWTQTLNVDPQDLLVEGVIGNNASYAEHVQGRNQSRVHRDNGWVTIDDALARSEAGIQAEFGAVAEALEKHFSNHE